METIDIKELNKKVALTIANLAAAGLEALSEKDDETVKQILIAIRDGVIKLRK